MFTAINVNAIFPYRSPKDPDQANPTIFKIGVLDPFIRSFIEDQTTKYDFDADHPTVVIDSSMRQLLTVKFGLRGIEGLSDPLTKGPLNIELEKKMIGSRECTVLPDSVIAMIPPELFPELRDVINRVNTLGENERKN